MKSTIALPQYQLTAPDLEVLLALVRAGTLVEAGKRLGVDASTVFRSIRRLEKQLGQRLFERSRSGYLPGELAQRIAFHAERVEAELEAARATATAPRDGVSGLVRLSTTDTILKGLVLPSLTTLAVKHPLLQMELVASNELASLTKRDADIAIRATMRAPEHLVGRKLGRIRTALYGPKDSTSSIADLAACDWIGPDEGLPEHPSVKWRRKAYPKVIPRWRVNTILAVQQAIESGLGIGVLPTFLADVSTQLVALTAPIKDCESELWLLTHPDSRHLRRIATVYSHLSENIKLNVEQI